MTQSKNDPGGKQPRTGDDPVSTLPSHRRSNVVSACSASHRSSSRIGTSFRAPIRTSRTSGSTCSFQMSQLTPIAAHASFTFSARRGPAPRSDVLRSKKPTAHERPGLFCGHDPMTRYNRRFV